MFGVISKLLKSSFALKPIVRMLFANFTSSRHSSKNFQLDSFNLTSLFISQIFESKAKPYQKNFHFGSCSNFNSKCVVVLKELYQSILPTLLFRNIAKLNEFKSFLLTFYTLTKEFNFAKRLKLSLMKIRNLIKLNIDHLVTILNDYCKRIPFHCSHEHLIDFSFVLI